MWNLLRLRKNRAHASAWFPVSSFPLHWLPAVAILALVAETALAQNGFQTTVPTDILTQFRNQRILWTTNVWVYANRLFGLLALIEFTWSAVTMVLDKTDLQSWTSALIRKIMWIGAFYALLINGRNWIPAIIDSFEQIGSNAAGMAVPLSPSNVMAQGIQIAGALMDSAGSAGFFTNPGTSFALVFCAILIVLSYVIITINFVVVMVESYIIVSVGFVFLGFGGSRWTAPYVERYLGLAVSIGIKIVLVYCLISAGFNLGVGWATEAGTVGTSAHPALTAFDAMGGAVIFMMLCWQIPKLFGAVLGGAPALTGGDLVTTGTALAAGGFAVGSLGAGAIASAAGASAAGAVSGTTSAAKIGAGSTAMARTTSEVSSAASATRSGPLPPPGSAGQNGTGSLPRPPSPSNRGPNGHGTAADVNTVSSRPHIKSPGSSAMASNGESTVLDNVGGERLAGSGFESERSAKGFVQQSRNLNANVTQQRGTTLTEHPRSDTEPSSPSEDGSVHARTPGPAEIVSTSAERANRKLQSASNRIRHLGRRVALDSAPQVSPPRMPIDHDD
ncbi:MAG TPA: P-type conjugative transfer protein TrbL [Bryobacteraceae bacterium]|nr:P-type conjugative transfer protein TrbL [Bryobacteraceae bacterium]